MNSLQYDELIRISPVITFKLTGENENRQIDFEIKTRERTISTSFHYPGPQSTVSCLTPCENMRYAVIHKT